MTDHFFEPPDFTTRFANSSDLRAPLITKLRQGAGLGWLRVAVLGILDSALLALSWTLATLWGTPIPTFQPFWNNSPYFAVLIPILFVTLSVIALQGLYGFDDRRRDWWGIVRAFALAQGLLIFMAFLYQPGLLFISRSTFLIFCLTGAFSLPLGRILVDQVINYLRRHGTARWPIYLLGDPGDIEQALKLLAHSDRYKVMGSAQLPLDPQQAEWQLLLQQIRESGVGEVFICSWQSVHNSIILYWSLRSAGLQLRILPLGLELPQLRSQVRMIGPLPTIQFSPPTVIGSDFWLKRSFDLVVVALALIVISPILALIALAIRWDSPGSILYGQTRIGLKGRPFKMWKFRTMISNADQLQAKLESANESKDGVLFKIKDDPRITLVGKFLRRYSLDELPQLFNVLLGEMSLVGPRPFPLRDVNRFAEHHFLRQEVLPGISGLWQVSGRSDIVDFEQVFRLDTVYIQNWSLMLDFQILLRTIKVVFKPSGAY